MSSFMHAAHIPSILRCALAASSPACAASAFISSQLARCCYAASDTSLLCLHSITEAVLQELDACQGQPPLSATSAAPA